MEGGEVKRVTKDAGMDENTAVMRLAKRFRDTMEYMDPTGSGDWEHVSEDDRRFYCAVVSAVLDDEALVLAALKESRPPPKEVA